MKQKKLWRPPKFFIFTLIELCTLNFVLCTLTKTNFSWMI